MKKGKRSHTLKDLIIPHKGNAYKPHALRTSAIVAALGLLILLQGAYLAQTKLSFLKTTLLASVLPSVLIGYTNDDRAANKLAALTPDPLLASAAQLKADDMAAKGYFSHVSPDGKTPWFWLDQVKYPYTYAGENLAIDFTDSKDVEEAWMASPAHHANIVKPQYTRIGIGTAQGVFEGHETTFVVQFFATPKKGVSLQGETVLGTTNNKQVLGAEISPLLPQTFSEFFAQIAASPLHTVTYILSALVGLFVVLLIIAIVIHSRIQFIEIIGGGLLVILVALCLIYINILDEGATVPDDVHAVASESK